MQELMLRAQPLLQSRRCCRGCSRGLCRCRLGVFCRRLYCACHRWQCCQETKQPGSATLSNNTQQFIHVQIVGVANPAAWQPGAAPAAQVSDAHAQLEAARLQIAQLQAQMQVKIRAPCLLPSGEDPAFLQRVLSALLCSFAAGHLPTHRQSLIALHILSSQR